MWWGKQAWLVCRGGESRSGLRGQTNATKAWLVCGNLCVDSGESGRGLSNVTGGFLNKFERVQE